MAQVIGASLAALNGDDVVCVPGLGDLAPLEELRAAELGIRAAANRSQRPSRRS
ncbi:hypothetical protein OG936_33630 [Streptomyces sp. NBC_00846]|uniref:hypothetical protein n=1 Tax=Streptomyces sp. NBC_00846 TaxID=2975849 RepID=UPI00386DA753|nr:hypothetical protein OG936_33630 [Streptomyces sp. NBC_00846]